MTVKQHPAYKYAKLVLAGTVPKHCEGVRQPVGRYVRKQAAEFIRIADGMDPKYCINEKRLAKITKLLKVMRMPSGLRAGVSVYDATVGYQWLFYVSVLCVVHRADKKHRRYETAVLEICRKNFKTFTVATVFILLMLLEPRFSKLFSVAPDGALSRQVQEAIKKILQSSPLLMPPDEPEKYGGVAYGRLKAETAKNEMHAKLEAVHGIALEMEQRVLDLMDGTADDLDLDPVHTFYRIDGISMKVRELSDCCPMHQCFGHLAVLALQPLLRAKLLPYQFASIPEKGQVALKRQVERWLRRKSLGVRYGLKMDVKSAYQNTSHAVVMGILEHEIPHAAWLLAVVRSLLAMAPHGGLLIGGYLEAWLFNLVASYLMRQLLSYAKARRSARLPLVQRCCSYMDDLGLFGRRWADMQSAARKITKWAKDVLGLTIKPKWMRVDFLTVEEERARRHLKGAAKGCPGFDMAGYRMHRTYTTIRRGIFKRIRRQSLRAADDLRKTGRIPLYRSYRLISYNGYFVGTKTSGAAAELEQRHLFKAAKWAVGAAARLREVKAG